MRHIKVSDHVTPIGQEYTVGSYPGPGVYYNRKTKMLYTVDESISVGLPPSVLDFLEDAEQFSTVESTVTPSPGFSEDFMLKALAIAQSPQLAINLLAKPA